MPTYDYRCESCGRFEVFQGIKEDALTRCPTCNGPVKRMISPGGGLLFKGSGFYTTDYRKPEYQQRRRDEEKKTGDGGTGAEKKSQDAGAGTAKANDGGGASGATGGAPSGASPSSGSGASPASGSESGSSSSSSSSKEPGS